MKKEKGNSYNITSVYNAMEVLEYIIKRQTDVHAVEIHSRLGIPKPTLHKLLQTLKELGYISQNPETQQYYATLRMLQMGYYSVDRWKFQSTYHPYVRMFLRRFNCPISLSAYSGTDAVIMYSAIGNVSINVDRTNTIGRTVPLYASSSGRLLLASMSDAEVKEVLSGIPFTPYTDRTAVAVEEVLKSLPNIREAGFARLDGELYYGFSNISFPLKDIRNQLIGSMNMVFKEDEIDSRLPQDTIEEIMATLDKVRISTI